ncbi:MAG: hypothetical protein AAF911_05915 [Planctomycetota bacterium]
MQKFVAVIVVVLMSVPLHANDVVKQIDLAAMGLIADGVTDDGPVIRRALSEAASHDGPAEIVFPSGSTVFISTGEESYAIRLDGVHDLTLSGHGTTVLLGPEVRFIEATSCERLVVTGFNLETEPLPMVEAKVVAVEPGGGVLTARLVEPERAHEMDGPLLIRGENRYFGMLWWPEKYSAQCRHYFITDMEPTENAARTGMVRVTGEHGLPKHLIQKIRDGDMRITLPIRGIAHLAPPGAMVVLDRCSDVLMEDIEMWSAPWFGFQIFRNVGPMTFRRVNIRPKPGTARVSSIWRDGFHVKGNRGPLLFEDCILKHMNDDAFNIASHALLVSEMVSPKVVRVRQVFPLQPMPVYPGNELLIVTPEGRRLDAAKVASVRVSQELPDLGHDAPTAPEWEITLEQPVSGLRTGCTLWDVDAANAQTVIRRCKIIRTLRVQSPNVVIEDSEITGLLWLNSELKEGPFASNAIIRRNILRQGIGNPQFALVVNGWPGHTTPKTLPPTQAYPLQGVQVLDNRIYGDLRLEGVANAVVRGNRFYGGEMLVENSPGLETDVRR